MNSKENFDVSRARKILDEDHYGLTDIKERIMEFIAVGKLRGTVQGILDCSMCVMFFQNVAVLLNLIHDIDDYFWTPCLA